MVRLLTSPGGPLLLATASSYLDTGGVAAPVVSAAYTGAHPSDITGLLHWWDSDLTTLQGAAGTAVGAYRAAGAYLADKASGGTAMVLPTSTANGAQSPTGTTMIPRLVGTQAGIGATLSEIYAPIGPLVDYTLSPTVAGVVLGSGVGRTIYFVWSRPQQQFVPYSAGYTTGSLAALTIGGTPIVSMTNTGTDTLSVLGGAGLGTLERRHTHSIALRWAPGGGIDVWLDDTQIATGISNSLASSLTASLTVGLGTAGLYLHEMAVWDHALTSGEMTTLLSSATSVSKRWTRGPRKGCSILIVGQSWASYLSNDATAQWQESVRYHGSFLGVELLNGTNRLPQGSPGFIAGGTPLFNTSGTFLLDPGTGADPSTWSTGTFGGNLLAQLAAFTSADRADIAAIFAPFSENDSAAIAWTDQVKYEKAFTRWFDTDMRGSIGQTGALPPILAISAWPYGGQIGTAGGNAGGIAAIRKSIGDLAAGSRNVFVVLPNTAACWARGMASDAATIAAGGVGHTDAVDNIAFACLAGPFVANAIITAGLGDVSAAVPNGICTVGPQISSATRVTSTSVLVTVLHDQGTDLLFPGTASSGTGFAILDGFVSPASPGTVILATSATRQTANTFLLGLASAMVNSASACRLDYPYGNQSLGRGSAVTDNYSLVLKPAGCDAGADLGAGYAPNYPIRTPSYPIQLS